MSKTSATRSRQPQGRRATINTEDLLTAALQLVGPHRSVSTLSLREVARAAGIAPNSFYRHFRDIDELAVALIERAGSALRTIIREARLRASREKSVVHSSVKIFIQQLQAGDNYLHLLLREGTVGSDAFKQAVEKQLRYFEEELCVDLIRLAELRGTGIYQPKLVAQSITRLVFAVGGSVMDTPQEEHEKIIDDLSTMVRMIIQGTQTMAEKQEQASLR